MLDEFLVLAERFELPTPATELVLPWGLVGIFIRPTPADEIDLPWGLVGSFVRPTPAAEIDLPCEFFDEVDCPAQDETVALLALVGMLGRFLLAWGVALD